MLARRGRFIALGMLTLHLTGCAGRPTLSVGGVQGAGDPWWPQPPGTRAALLSTRPRPQEPQVDERAFWDWVDDQKWFIALGIVLVLAIVVAATDDDDCGPADYCLEP